MKNGIESKDAFSTPASLRGAGAVLPSGDSPTYSDSLAVSHLIRAYQMRGHEMADLDPLGLHSYRDGAPPELDIKYHGFKDSDIDRPLNLLGKSIGGNAGFLDILGKAPKNMTLKIILDNLRKTYCSTLGVEYMHIASKEKCNW